jgi:hypothetical protein
MGHNPGCLGRDFVASDATESDNDIDLDEWEDFNNYDDCHRLSIFFPDSRDSSTDDFDEAVEGPNHPSALSVEEYLPSGASW